MVVILKNKIVKSKKSKNKIAILRAGYLKGRIQFFLKLRIKRKLFTLTVPDCKSFQLHNPLNLTVLLFFFFFLFFLSSIHQIDPTSQNPQEANLEDAARLFVKLVLDVHSYFSYHTIHTFHSSIGILVHEYHTQVYNDLYSRITRLYIGYDTPLHSIG